VKRFIDTALVLVAAPLWLPLSALVAAIVAVSMGRPVLFSQDRAGLGGKVFKFLKFRTMRDGDGPDAERITRVGRVLRATSLDELPQLFHVLSGKMSLVGPRPLPARYLPRYSKEQARRHETRPGMTGWAQINGRNAISWEEKFKHDVWYVDNRSAMLDLKILLLTFLKVFRREGINSSAAETMGEFNPRQYSPQG
jgi:lipopolysaccharide/colanic/teichoic acid biosynthesis glycosyltransferase